MVEALKSRDRVDDRSDYPIQTETGRSLLTLTLTLYGSGIARRAFLQVVSLESDFDLSCGLVARSMHTAPYRVCCYLARRIHSEFSI